MNLAKIEVHIDLAKPEQIEALNVFFKTVGNVEPIIQVPEKIKKLKVVEAKEVVPAPAAEASEAPEETPAAEAAEAPEETPAAEATEEGIKIEDVRSLLAKKVTAHRDAIKDKLAEFKAANVSSLDKKHYQDFVDFLNGLA